MRQETHIADEAEKSQRRVAMRRARLVVVVVALLLVAGLAKAVLVKVSQSRALDRQVADARGQQVLVTKAKRNTGANTITLPGTLQGAMESPIYARTNGYVKSWAKDIGARVEKGQVLAEIDNPEIDQELMQIEANRKQIESRVALAQSSLERWKNLRKIDAVSQQELDERQATYSQAVADLAAGDANVRRLRQLRSFRSVVAPFAGVITRRNVEVGDLVNAGNAGANRELFRLAQTDPLRVYVSVPQTYASQVKIGQPAKIELRESPGAIYTGKVARTANAIDPVTRTMQVEITQPNADGKLMPGAYAQVILSTEMSASLTVPSNTLLFRKDGPTIAVVGSDGRVHLQSVRIGQDYGRTVEIIGGLQGSEQLIINPSDSIEDGEQVVIAKAEAPGKT
jgi:multidrug efflux system membrane fusion protein